MSFTWGTDALVYNTIVAFGVSGDGIDCWANSTAELTCCDIYGNEAGDWRDCIAEQLGVDGNMSEDPCFCADSVYLGETSPCQPDNNSCAAYIGAFEIGCDDCGQEVPVAEISWGKLKAGYRDATR
jgi:hypothetical protein